MSFYPEKGIYSREEFNSSSGASFDNPYLQGITGGVVTLLNIKSGSTTAIKTWRDVYNWNLEDNLVSLYSIKQTFDISSGVSAPSEVNTVSGYVEVLGGAQAVTIETDYPTYVNGYGYSGRGAFCVGSYSTSPNNLLYSAYLLSGNNKLTIEFDVASYTAYSGLNMLSGFIEGQENLTGLSPLTGVLGHGVFFTDGFNWDFIEVTPIGIRSLNHPELAIPHNFLNPTRVRLAFTTSDIYISLEDGKTIAGYNKFNTEVSNPGDDPIFAFGSIASKAYLPVVENYGAMQTVDASVGKTQWDNIKIITGQIALHEDYGSEIYYSTGSTSMYTAPFDPGINIEEYLTATIGYRPFEGGTTTITAQYSGLAGWSDGPSVSLTGVSYQTKLNLETIPIYYYNRQDLGTDYLSNPIRFKITQRSTDGNKLPPVVEWIDVIGRKDRVRIDLLPDWKLVDASVNVKIAIESGTFITDDPTPDMWTRLLINSPAYTGSLSGQGSTGFYDEAYEIPVRVFGQGELIQDGRYRYSYKNFTEGYLSATNSGSEAYSYFGNTPVNNIFPNPIFDQGFRVVGTGDSNYYTGLTLGELAANVIIPRNYTGTYRVDYVKEPVYRPEAQGRANRINRFNGNGTSVLDEFAQGVVVYPNNTAHNGTVGIEAVCPSGIATGQLMVSMDLQISEGSGIAVSIFSTTTGQFYLNGDLFRDFRSVAFPYTATNDKPLYIKLAVPSGYAGANYRYIVDNISVAPYNSSYISCTGNIGYLHYSGMASEFYSGTGASYISTRRPVDRAATYLNSDVYLYCYPSTASGVLGKVYDTNGKGIELNIDPSGYITAIFDTQSDSWSSTADLRMLENFARQEIRSNDRVPLGRWTNIGFCHDVHSFEEFSFRSVSGEKIASNNTSNRAYISIDGKITASKDTLSGWTKHVTSLGDKAPYTTYIPMSGVVTSVIASGLTCAVDAFEIGRPPVLDVEETLSINAARNSAPYFVPNSLFSLGNLDSNLLTTGSDYLNVGKDIYLGSCYNFSSPVYANWDRGTLRNHCVIVGNPTNLNDCPYEEQELNSSLTDSGNYYLSNYSSAYHRLQFGTGQIPLSISSMSEGLFNTGNKVAVAGWIKPLSTGNFFTLYNDHRYITGGRMELNVFNNKLTVVKYSTTGNIAFSVTGQSIELSGWNYFGVFAESPTSYQEASTGYTTVYISDENGISNPPTMLSGFGAGIIYKGTTGDVGQSFMKFGGTSQCQLFNWIVPIVTDNTPKDLSVYATDSSKSGRYQTLLKNNAIYTGEYNFSNYNLGTLPIRQNAGPEDIFFSVALHSSYSNLPKLNGTLTYDDKPFKVIQSYNVRYDTAAIEKVYGGLTSPIRVGYNVPINGINIAKYSNPAFTVSSSISTLDLSDYNSNNLLTYKNGEYLIGNSFSVNSVLSGYRGINSSFYSGRIDAVISGQVVSPDIEVSTINITDPALSSVYPAYYYYLVGRGSKAVKINGAYPHYTGNIDRYSTGSIPDNYIANLEKVKGAISLKYRDGTVVPKETFPYDVYISATTPDKLIDAITSGVSLSIDNIGTYNSGYVLDNGTFTTLLVTNQKFIDGKTIFVHYNAIDLFSKEEATHKEVLNCQPIYRERLPGEASDIGKFDIYLSQNNYYNIKIYGVESGFNDKL